MVNCENDESRETHLNNFHANDVVLMELPTCLHCLAALEVGTLPLGVYQNIMSHDACDAAVDRLPAFKKAELAAQSAAFD